MTIVLLVLGSDNKIISYSYPLADLESDKLRITAADKNNVWRTIDAIDLPKLGWKEFFLSPPAADPPDERKKVYGKDGQLYQFRIIKLLLETKSIGEE